MNRNRFHGAVMAALVFSLAACGGSDTNNDLAGTGDGDAVARLNARGSQRMAGAQQQPGQGTADAEGLNCNLAAPSGPDMVGVTIGMSADDAYRAIACSNPALRVEYGTGGGFNVPPPPGGGQMRTSIVARSDYEQITATLVGLPGQERVITIARSVRYRSGEELALDALHRQLQGKYGEMRQDFGTGVRNIAIGHVRTPEGRPIAGNEDSPDYGRCLPIGSAANIVGDCGLAVRFVITPNPNNRQLVSSFEAVMTDGATGMRIIDDYRAVAGRAQQQRHARDVEQAKGRTPNL